MAEPALQREPEFIGPTLFAENVPGPYGVNSECIDCDLCRQIAPKNFVRQVANEHSYVAKQPANERERQQCAEALVTCPVRAIEARRV